MYVVLTYRLTVDWGAGVMALWSIWNQSESTPSLKREESAGSLFQECTAFSKRQVHGYNVTLSWMKPSLNRYRRYVYVQWPWALIARGLMAFTFHLRIWDVETFTTLQLSHRKPVDTGNTAEHRDGTAGQREERETRGNCGNLHLLCFDFCNRQVRFRRIVFDNLDILKKPRPTYS